MFDKLRNILPKHPINENTSQLLLPSYVHSSPAGVFIPQAQINQQFLSHAFNQDFSTHQISRQPLPNQQFWPQGATVNIRNPANTNQNFIHNINAGTNFNVQHQTSNGYGYISSQLMNAQNEGLSTHNTATHEQTLSQISNYLNAVPTANSNTPKSQVLDNPNEDNEGSEPEYISKEVYNTRERMEQVSKLREKRLIEYKAKINAFRNYFKTGVLDLSNIEKRAQHTAKNFRKSLKNYRLIKDDVIQKKKKDGSWATVLTELETIKDTLWRYHTTVLGGHCAYAILIKQIGKEYHWKGMSEDCQEYVLCCIECSRKKDLKHFPRQLKQITVTEADEMLQMDICGRFPTTKYGHKYVLVLQDKWTKYAVFYALQEKSCVNVAHVLRDYILRYRCPKIILTDCGGEFRNLLMKCLCEILHIDKRTTKPYTPQTNGLAERLVGIFKTYLSKSVQLNFEQDNWDETLLFCQGYYNRKPHSATGFTPGYLRFFSKEANILEAENVLKIEARAPDMKPDYLSKLDESECADFGSEQQITSVDPEYIEINKSLDGVKKIQDLVNEKAAKVKERYAKEHDKKMKSKGLTPTELEVGMKVFRLRVGKELKSGLKKTGQKRYYDGVFTIKDLMKEELKVNLLHEDGDIIEGVKYEEVAPIPISELHIDHEMLEIPGQLDNISGGLYALNYKSMVSLMDLKSLKACNKRKKKSLGSEDEENINEDEENINEDEENINEDEENINEDEENINEDDLQFQSNNPEISQIEQQQSKHKASVCVEVERMTGMERMTEGERGVTGAERKPLPLPNSDETIYRMLIARMGKAMDGKSGERAKVKKKTEKVNIGKRKRQANSTVKLPKKRKTKNITEKKHEAMYTSDEDYNDENRYRWFSREEHNYFKKDEPILIEDNDSPPIQTPRDYKQERKSSTALRKYINKSNITCVTLGIDNDILQKDDKLLDTLYMLEQENRDLADSNLSVLMELAKKELSSQNWAGFTDTDATNSLRLEMEETTRFAQIIFTPGHWILIGKWNDDTPKGSSTFYIYDSKKKKENITGHTYRSCCDYLGEVFPRLSFITLRVASVEQQVNNHDCGYYALSSGVLCLNGVDPSTVKFGFQGTTTNLVRLWRNYVKSFSEEEQRFPRTIYQSLMNASKSKSHENHIYEATYSKKYTGEWFFVSKSINMH